MPLTPLTLPFGREIFLYAYVHYTGTGVPFLVHLRDTTEGDK